MTGLLTYFWFSFSMEQTPADARAARRSPLLLLRPPSRTTPSWTSMRRRNARVNQCRATW
eukprot:scaffold2632_cov124-Isochrysis_galbana.AAC.3